MDGSPWSGSTRTCRAAGGARLRKEQPTREKGFAWVCTGDGKPVRRVWQTGRALISPQVIGLQLESQEDSRACQLPGLP